NVRKIGNRIERNAINRIDAGQRDEDGSNADEKYVSGRPTDDSSYHLGGSDRVNSCNAVFRLLSASIRNVADVTTSSPLATPERISTYPLPRRPSFTVRGSKRPSPFEIRTT